jgi:hypothetical protein
MSRSPDGARLVLRVLQSDSQKSGWRALAEAIAGPEGVEIAARLFESGVEELKEEEGEEEGQEQGAPVVEGGVVAGIGGLTLAPQQVDAQTQKQQPAVVAKMDRENGMVLVAELLQNFPEELLSLRKPLEAVLAKGGELVMQDRGEGQK